MGLDVHKDSVTIAIAAEGREGAMLSGKFPNNFTTLQRHFAKWRKGTSRSGRPHLEGGRDRVHSWPVTVDFESVLVFIGSRCNRTLAQPSLPSRLILLDLI